MLLKMKASYSLEAKEALKDGHYSRALRRLVKRRRAFAQATPFAVSILGVADSYAFHNDTLLYIVGDRLERSLRILDLQRATNQEIVVDVSTLATYAVPESEGCRKYVFRILYHASGITSCLYSFARPTTHNWLLIFDAQKHRLLGKIELDSTIRLFVRNNSKHLIFGTHSEYDINGHRKWVLHYFNIQEPRLPADSMQLTNLVGYEIGSNIAFEIFDDHFYGCSSQTSFELEEIDWTSHYYCFRFPLDEFDSGKIEVMNKRDTFRRQHLEGPIDDRWTFLNFERHEETGAIQIVECRREWLNGGSENRRSYYTKAVKFRDQSSGSNGEDENGGQDDGNDPLPDVQLASLVGSHDRPNYMKAAQRLPHEYHHGDYGTDIFTFTKNKTYMSFYSNTCGTFIDFVDDPLPNEPLTQRLRIRTGLRTFYTAATQHGPHDQQLGHGEGSAAAQRNIISCWPPDPSSTGSKTQADMLEKLDLVMNPAGLRGHVTATGNDRSIIYSTSDGASDSMKALIYLSFDPSVRLSGMVRAGCLHAEIMTGDDNEGNTQACAVDPKEKNKETRRAAQWHCHKAYDEQKASAAALPSLPPIPWSIEQDLQPNTVQSPEEGVSWARLEDAMHQRFSAKYCFGFGGVHSLRNHDT
ncbi:f-box domain-containing protein [Seiridium cupressi]